jgi:hypothetical protein
MWPFRGKAATSDAAAGTDAARTPDIILAGLGARDRAELSVEVQRLLTRVGRAFALGLTPGLRTLMASMRVHVTELDGHFAPGKAFGQVYADVASTVLQQTALEKPVVLLTRGNPMFMNTVCRTLVIEGRRLGLNVQVLPGISLVDTLVNDIGIDVGIYGLQVFDAHWLTLRRLPLSSKVPALILNMEGFGLESVPANGATRSFDPLLDHLECHYQRDHAVTMIRTGPSGGLAFERRSLHALREAQDLLPSLTCLFLDAAPEPVVDAPK